MNYKLFYKADEAVGKLKDLLVSGVTGSKVSYHSIPYKSIVSYEIETAGTLDLDAELKIYISGQAEPLKKEFKKGSNIKEVGQLIGEHLLHA